MTVFDELTINNQEELIMGTSPHSVKCGNELTIGDGKVYPEINFTLPTMMIIRETMSRVLR